MSGLCQAALIKDTHTFFHGVAYFDMLGLVVVIWGWLQQVLGKTFRKTVLKKIGLFIFLVFKLGLL